MIRSANVRNPSTPAMARTSHPQLTPGAFTRLLRLLRDRGPKTVWLKVLYELKLYRRCELHWNDIDVESQETTSRIQVHCAPLEPDQLALYLAFRPDQEQVEIQGRLDAGHHCCVAWRDGRIIGAAWGGRGRVPLRFLDRDLVLPPDAYYGYDNYVLPQFRGSQVVGSLLSARHRHLRQSYPRSIGIIWPGNRAAVRRRAKLGFRVFGELGYYGLGRWRRHFLRLDPAIVDLADPPLRLVPRT